MSIHTMLSLRPEHVIRQLPWQLDNKTALGFLLILATFSLVGWLYLTQASSVTTTSYRIDELRMELDQIQNQNAAITLEIARLEALPRIENRARELGFEPTTNVRYLPVTNYPISTEKALTYQGGALTQSEAETYATVYEQSSWWIKTLDSLTAWLTNE